MIKRLPGVVIIQSAIWDAGKHKRSYWLLSFWLRDGNQHLSWVVTVMSHELLGKPLWVTKLQDSKVVIVSSMAHKVTYSSVSEDFHGTWISKAKKDKAKDGGLDLWYFVLFCDQRDSVRELQGEHAGGLWFSWWSWTSEKASSGVFFFLCGL